MNRIDHFLKEHYPDRSVTAVLELLEEGCSVPFIARYRKERTGSLEDTAILEIEAAHKKLQDHLARQQSILKAIEDQGLLTKELRSKIETCYDEQKLEDLYLPYKKRKKTRADKARDNGLEGLARIIMAQRDNHPEEAAKGFLNQDVPTAKEALAGARDIMAEWVNTDAFIREGVRDRFMKHAVITAKIKASRKEEGQKFRDYYDYSEKLVRCPSHRYLAILRGENEGMLIVHILPDEDRTIEWIVRKRVRNNGPCRPYVEEAILDAYRRLLSPSIENQVKASYKQKADKDAIDVFAQNLEQLLMAAPLGEKRILALDPGFRTGCKLVCLSETGQLLYNNTIYPHPPQNDRNGAGELLRQCIKKYEPKAVAIGDGTAGRETLDWIKSLGLPDKISLHLVNENGASIYSASEIARKEFPDKDVTVRGAVSIGRRLMDPLAELIKIDPKSIGVGQYQHDVNQSWLSERLEQVVTSCVNRVGVNLNTASVPLLSHISGLGPTLAENIVGYRDKHGAFSSREQLHDVDRLGPKAFEQCSGFLRIRNGDDPLDNTGVHPESYHIVENICQTLGLQINEIIENGSVLSSIDPRDFVSDAAGLPTIKDIINELLKPGIDIRGEVEEFEFLDEIRTFEDLYEDMVLPGVVRNLTDFGAFVDIGIKEAGLVHISEISDTFIKHPSEKLSLDQKVMVRVMGLDAQRRRIQLSIKQGQKGRRNE